MTQHTALIDQLTEALAMLLDDVEGNVDYGMPFEDPEHGWHESVMAARAALAASELHDRAAGDADQ